MSDLLDRVRVACRALARHEASRADLQEALDNAIAAALTVARRDGPTGGTTRVVAATCTRSRPDGLGRMATWRRAQNATDTTPPGPDVSLDELLPAVTEATEKLLTHVHAADKLRDVEYDVIYEAGQAARNSRSFPFEDVVRATRNSWNPNGLAVNTVKRIRDGDRPKSDPLSR